MPASGINFHSRGGFRFVSLLVLAFFLLAPFRSLLAQTGSEVVVTHRYANIRSGPGTKYARIGRVYRGDRFPVVDILPKWYRIMYKGRDAWIYAPLVRLEQAIPSQADIEEVSQEISLLNQRLDRVIEKINEAGERLAEKIAAAKTVPEAPEKSAGPLEGESGKIRGAPGVSPAWLFVPGGPRLAAGDKYRGLSLLAATAGCIAAGVYYHRDYRDYLNSYRELPPGTPAGEFERLHDKAGRRRNISESFFYAAAGLYAANVLDYFLFLPGKQTGFRVEAAPAGGQKIKLSMSHTF